MIRKVAWVTIWSEDLNNLLPFYRDVLGMKVVEQHARFVALSGSEEGPDVGLGTHSEVKSKASDPYRHMIGLGVDDIDATYRELSARGVEFIEPPTDQPCGGRQAQFKDQDGNTLVLVQR